MVVVVLRQDPVIRGLVPRSRPLCTKRHRFGCLVSPGFGPSSVVKTVVLERPSPAASGFVLRQYNFNSETAVSGAQQYNFSTGTAASGGQAVSGGQLDFFRFLVVQL